MARTDSAMARAEDLIRTYSGGASTVEGKFDPDFMLYILDQFRAVAIMQFYQLKNRNIALHYTLQQPYTAIKDSADQVEDPVTGGYCFVKFKMPAVIIINEVVDGFGYVGSPNGATPYRRLRSRIQMSDLMANQLLREDKERIYYVTCSDGTVEVLNNPGQNKLLTEACFMQPTQVPGFSIDDDRYPINDSIMAIMKELVTKVEMNPIAISPEDRIADFQSQITKLKHQIGVK